MVTVLLSGCLTGPPPEDSTSPQWIEVVRRDGEIHWVESVDEWLVWREWTGSADQGDLAATLIAYHPATGRLEHVASAPNMNGPIRCGDEVVYSTNSRNFESSEAHAWQPEVPAYRIDDGDWVLNCGADWKGFMEAHEANDLAVNYTVVWENGSIAAFPEEPLSSSVGTIDERPFLTRRNGDGTTFYEIAPDGSLMAVAVLPYVIIAFSGDGGVVTYIGGPTVERTAMYALQWPDGSPERLDPKGWYSPVSLAWNGHAVLYEDVGQGAEKRLRAIDLEDGSEDVWPIPYPGRSHATLAVTDGAAFVALVEQTPTGKKSVMYRLDVII